jgi:hypothetical protein
MLTVTIVHYYDGLVKSVKNLKATFLHGFRSKTAFLIY